MAVYNFYYNSDLGEGFISGLPPDNFRGLYNTQNRPPSMFFVESFDRQKEQKAITEAEILNYTNKNYLQDNTSFLHQEKDNKTTIKNNLSVNISETRKENLALILLNKAQFGLSYPEETERMLNISQSQ